MARISNEEKIKRIISGRESLLKYTKEELHINKIKLSNNIDYLINSNFKNNNLNDYKKIEEAKKVIINLTEEIANCSNTQDIVNIRKKLNYYINKIKKELKKRNISDEELESYSDKTKYLRKDIVKYIRYLKRENNINEIIELNNNVDNLSIDDKNRLKRLLKNENDYIRRNLKLFNKEDKKEERKEIVQPEEVIDIAPEETIMVPKPKKKGLLKKVTSLVLAGTIAIGGLVESLKNKNYKVDDLLDEENPIESVVDEDTELENVIYTSLTYAEKPIDLNYYSQSDYLSDVLSNNIDNQEDLEKSAIEIIEEEPEIEVSIDEKTNYLLEYFNMKKNDEMNRFFAPFIETMEKYGVIHNYDSILNIFYEVALIPLEEKIEFIKEKCGINDDELNITAATFGAEGYGGGLKYEDVYAVSQTGENRTQCQKWMNYIEAKAGSGTGDNIYYAMMTGGYYAKGNSYYQKFLGNRDLEYFKAVVDCIYITEKYGLYMHNCTEFNMPSATNKGVQFVASGNRFYTAFSPSDRIIDTEDVLVLKRTN